MSKISNGGSDQYLVLNALVDSFLSQSEKCGNEGVKQVFTNPLAGRGVNWLHFTIQV